MVRKCLLFLLLISLLPLQAQEEVKKEQPVEKFYEYIKKPYGNEYFLFRLGLNAGGSYLLNLKNDSWPEAYSKHKQRMSLGILISSELSFYAFPRYGIGVKYFFFQSSSQSNNIEVPNIQKNGLMEENMRLHFIGPYVFTRLSGKKNKRAVVLGLSVGSYFYDSMIETADKRLYKGNSYGILLDLGYEFQIKKNIDLALSIAYSRGFIKKISQKTVRRIETIELDQPNFIDLSRVDITLGIRYQK
ncbi:MAG: hypothetical protein ACEPOW_00835 [Bacteroidales bacterium]